MKNKTNKIFIPILLIANIVVGLLIYRSVKDDVEYANKVYQIDKQVIEKLQEIQKAQMAYRDMKGHFADNFDSLIHQFKFGKYPKIRSIGDLDKDSTTGLRIDTLLVNPIVEVFGREDYPIGKLSLVPPADTAHFLINAKFIEKNNVQVPVFEVVAPHPYNKERTLKIGSLDDAIYSGNWK
jgi:hypothetical protein